MEDKLIDVKLECLKVSAKYSHNEADLKKLAKELFDLVLFDASTKSN